MSDMVRRLAAAAAVITAVVAATGCGSSGDTGSGASPSGSTGGAAQSGDVTVDIKNFAFGPQSLTVTVGSKVTWKNDDTTTHTATAGDGTFDTGNINASSSSKTVTFSKAGTFQYRCNIHQYMTATVTVTS